MSCMAPLSLLCRRAMAGPFCSAAGTSSKCIDASLHPGIARVVLKKGKAQIFVNGNPMVYSGAIDRVIGKPPPNTGDLVVVTNGAEEPIGWGVYNAVSMFRVRVFQTEDEAQRDPQCAFDIEKLIESRICAAMELRKMLGLPSNNTNVYRLVNSEGDRLSGLVVDVFGDHVVVATSAAWVEKYKSNVKGSIEQVLGKASMTWRPSVELLKEEGIQLQTEADESTEQVQVVENGISYQIALGGQKTGFYVDQRENRLLLRSLCKQKSVLDLCCYSGGFALNAAIAGASHVIGVDSSRAAIELAKTNAQLNHLDTDSIIFEKADIVQYMRAAAAEGKSWDIVVLDPPKLAPNRKALEKAAIKYRSLNALAMQLTKPGSLLMTCSCSGAMTQSNSFLSLIQDAARTARRRVALLREAGAGPDHPLDPAYPEGSYLTNYLLRVL